MIVVQQPAKSLLDLDAPQTLGLSPADDLVSNPLVAALVMVVRRVFRDGSIERILPEEYHPIQALGLDGSHEALGEGVHVWSLA